MILGHARREVIDAIVDAASRGTSYGAPTEGESELAELICAAMPSIEKVRLVSSGTEATMSAIRLARGATGRAKIVKFAGNYHGHADCLLVAAGSSAANLGVPDSPGVTEGTSRDTIVMEYNDAAGLEALFTEQGKSIACIILETCGWKHGLRPATAGFLQTARRLCDQYGSVLIFRRSHDRLSSSLWWAQSIYGVRPDLTTLGKIVGGACHWEPTWSSRSNGSCSTGRQVFQAGTLSGNPGGNCRWPKDY